MKRAFGPGKIRRLDIEELVEDLAFHFLYRSRFFSPGAHGS
jgi:hypothetical protein